ncbi:MAG: hypothetical protein OSB02_03030 [Rhodospirillaceae bacterium]|nr:hypothetical protein [Rhodospirillaceae bacterium]
MGHPSYINPPTFSESLTVAYSQVTVAKPDQLLFVAGHVGRDENREMVSDASLHTQERKALDNIRVA